VINMYELVKLAQLEDEVPNNQKKKSLKDSVIRAVEGGIGTGLMSGISTKLVGESNKSALKQVGLGAFEGSVGGALVDQIGKQFKKMKEKKEEIKTPQA
jgi:hypothetical protein